MLSREREKLETALSAHQGYGRHAPILMFVIDTNKEQLADQGSQIASRFRRRDSRHQQRSRRHHLSHSRQ